MDHPISLMTRHFAQNGRHGPIWYCEVHGSILVLGAQDKPIPIDEASYRACNENSLAVWTIRIGRQVIPGPWAIVDREFRLSQ